MPHLWPTGSSWVSPSIAARYFSSGPSDSISRWTPCPPKHSEQWLQLRLGCIRLSPSCPFRRVHTFCSPRPARNYPRFWIWHPSFGRQRDLNPPDQRAARRALWGRKTARPSILGRLRSPLAAVLPLLRAEMGSSPGFIGNPFGNMPRASDSGDFGPPFAMAVVPDTAFRC